MWTNESPLLKLDYEFSMDLRFCEFEAVETGRERFKFGDVDCEGIIQMLYFLS
jgi:hypothetical protein